MSDPVISFAFSPPHTHPHTSLQSLLHAPPRAPHPQTDAATEFTKAARPDLAEKEQREAALLTALLPPLLATAEIDRVLCEVLAEPGVADALAKGPAPRALGQVFKAFYARVDKSDVDPDVVRARAQAAVGSSA